MNLIFHHTGIVVDNIEEVAASYKPLFGENSISKKYYVSTQGVNVCFIAVGSGAYLELVESATENSVVNKLRKKGQTYYHVGYLTTNIEATVQELILLNYKPLEFFKSEAFEGKRCIFLFSPDAHLIELIEK